MSDLERDNLLLKVADMRETANQLHRAWQAEKMALEAALQEVEQDLLRGWYGIALGHVRAALAKSRST